MPPRRAGEIEKVTRELLKDHLANPLSHAALALARALDARPLERDLPGLAREFRTTLNAIGVEPTRKQTDLVDELGSRRKAKGA